MIRMQAVKRFMKSGIMVEEGETFRVENEALAREFETRELAKRIAATSEDDTAAPTAPNYEEMTVKELRALAKEAGIEGYSHLTKNQLIDALSA